MKKLLLTLSILSASVFLSAQTSNWQSIGPNDFNQASSGKPTTFGWSDFAVSPSNVPHAAFINTVSHVLSVRKFNGTTWEDLGGATGANLGTKSNVILGFDNAGVLHVLSVDYSTANISFNTYDGTSWGNVYGPGLSGSSQALAFCFDASNNLHIAYASNNKIIVSKYDATTFAWTPLDPTSLSHTAVGSSNLIFDASGTLYLRNGREVAKYNGTSWTYIRKTNPNSSALTLTKDNAGRPLIAFDSTGNPNYTLRTMYYNGTTWQNVNTGIALSFLPSTTLCSKIYLGKDNKNYLFFYYSSTPGKPSVLVNTGSAWVSVFTNTVLPFPATPLNVTDVPYLDVDNASTIFFGVNNNNTTNGHMLMYKYQNSNWSFVGNKDITNAAMGTRVSLAIAPNGQQYVLSNDKFGFSGIVVAVKKFNGVTWDSVGRLANPYITGLSSINKIKINNAGVPYISYKHGVYKFNGSNWINLNASGGASDMEVVNDTVYTVNANATQILFVNKFNGTTWSQVGGAVNVNQTYSNVCDIAVDGNGIIYVAYSESGKVLIKKYVGGAWQLVGAFITETASDIDFKFDKNGVPYVAFNNDPNHKASVYKFDGTNWIAVGQNFIDAKQIKLEFDSTNLPTVLFRNTTPLSPDINKLRTMQFNGATWSDIGGTVNANLEVQSLDFVKNPLTKKLTEAYISTLDYTNNNATGTLWVKELGVASGVGIKEITANNNILFSIYPNPTSSMLYVKLEMINEAPVTITITNALGQVILTELANSNNITLRTDNFITGMYFVTITDGKGNKGIRKIIKQ